LSEDAVNRCWACKSEIASEAKKCVNCGSYQGFRKHVDFSQVTLALLIALLAVATTLPSSIISGYQFLMFLREPLIVARVLDIKPERLTLYIENNSGEEFIVNELGCMVFFPIDSQKQIVERLSQYSETGHLSDLEWPKQTETINPIVIAYSTPAIILSDSNSMILELTRFHSFIAVEDSASENRIPSYCAMDVSKIQPLQDIQIIELPKDFYRGFDLKSLIETTEILNTSKTNREALLQKLSGYESSN
jgi:hypothetical protein